VYPKGTYFNLYNNQDVLDIIEHYDNVKLYMNGHNHAGGFAFHDGIYCLNFKAMVNNPKASTFAICYVYQNFIIVDGMGSEYDRIIPFNEVEELPFVPDNK